MPSSRSPAPGAFEKDLQKGFVYPLPLLGGRVGVEESIVGFKRSATDERARGP